MTDIPTVIKKPLDAFDPVWAEHPGACSSCGYDLSGLVENRQCPECGESFARGVLILFGIPNGSSGMSPVRRGLWISISVGWFFALFFWQLLFLAPRLVVYLGIGMVLVLIAGTIAMLLTSQRERSGVERLIFTSSGIVRAPRHVDLNQSHLDSIKLAYRTGDFPRLKRISPTWYRLEITNRAEKPLFSAGFRCTDEVSVRVLETVRDFMGIKIPPHPPTMPVPASQI